MSKKKQSHLRGERGQAFTDKIRGGTVRTTVMRLPGH